MNYDELLESFDIKEEGEIEENIQHEQPSLKKKRGRGGKGGKNKQKNNKNKTYKSDDCKVSSILENNNGSLYVYNFGNTDSTHKIFIAKLKEVEFASNPSIFAKGRQDPDSFNNQDVDTIPDIKFWQQRYYYFSKFDEGIKLDYESI